MLFLGGAAAQYDLDDAAVVYTDDKSSGWMGSAALKTLAIALMAALLAVWVGICACALAWYVKRRRTVSSLRTQRKKGAGLAAPSSCRTHLM